MGASGVVSVELDVVVPLDFADWYGAVADGVTRRVSAAVGDQLLGREAAAEAFARAYERWPRVSVMESPEGWVYRVAVNICRRSWRQRVLESRALARTLPAAIGHIGDHHDDVYRAFRRLPGRMRTAIRLRYWDDLTERQVAERMGVSPGTVSALLSTGRARLRRALGSDPSEPGGHR
jgi:RNA polymerase sigma-70 factor (ECF subfamily)